MALIIYVRVGIEIFQKRSQLRALDDLSSNRAEQSSNRNRPFTGLRTTEVEVRHDDCIKDELMFPLPAYTKTRRTPVVVNRYSITITSPDSATPAPTRLTNMLARPSNMDKVKWAYTKVAMLFAISIIITWVPSSINRVYGLRYPNDPSYALNIGSAIVLPLQGFWNTIIYFTTSLSICKGLWAQFRGQKRNTRCNGGFAVLKNSQKTPEKETGGALETSVNRGRISLADSI